MSDLFIDYDGKLDSDGELEKKFSDNEHIKTFINCIDESKGFVIFAGAGLSKLCGLPLWGEFANKLLEQCYKDKLISFFEKEDLKKHVNNDKMLISIVHSKYQEAGLLDEFNKVFKELLKNNPNNKKESRLVTAIKNLRASIITTNADKILDRCVLSENNYFGKKFDNLDEATLFDIFADQPKIFHIHGSINSKDGLIFTIEDYIDKYKEPSFNRKVSSLLNSDGIPVLFVGTSMTELELLQYILFRDNSGEKNRFILTGFYDYQDEAASQQESIIYYENIYMQNSGIDYSSNSIFDVISILGGTVIDVKNDNVLGTIVEIRHTNELISIYQSLGETTVKVDDEVVQGQVIGKSGKSNLNVDVPNCLHFELYYMGKIVNPEDYYDKNLTDL